MSREVERWEWTDGDGPKRFRDELASAGVTRFRMLDADSAADHPRALAHRLLGDAAAVTRVMTTRVTVRAGPRRFVSTSAPAPLHTDNVGVPPPHLQVMVCHRAAVEGGESLYLDLWPVLEEIRHADPRLYQRLFSEPRQMRYSLGIVSRPTIGLLYGSLVITHPPQTADDDHVGRELQSWIDRHAPFRFRAEPSDVWAVDNHRMLHGREAFSGDRLLTRLLIWLHQPLARTGPEPRGTTLDEQGDLAAYQRLTPVLACLAGDPVEDVAARHGMSTDALLRAVDVLTATALSEIDGVDAAGARRT